MTCLFPQQMQLDAKREELNKMKAAVERIKAGTQSEETIVLHEFVSMYSSADVKYKVIPGNLKPIIEQMKKD